jgi:hypothetical protein
VPSDHLVGPGYHILGQLYEADQFIRKYHQAGVRATVQSQLATMAASGATAVRTRLWQTADEADNPLPSTWLCFPYSSQDLVNIRQYAADVRGAGMQLIYTMLWLSCAHYLTGTPETTVGDCGYTWAQFLARAQVSIAGLAQASRRYVTRVELDGEILLGNNNNTERFMTDLWPTFYATMRAAGITPSVYFIVGQGESLHNPWTDPLYPILNDHESMFWVYRAVKWMQDQGYVLPSRLDVSSYFYPVAYTPQQWAERILADFQAVLPAYQMGIAEMFYDATHAAAWVKAFQKRNWPVVITFWPEAVAAPGVSVLSPFTTLPSYLPTVRYHTRFPAPMRGARSRVVA